MSAIETEIKEEEESLDGRAFDTDDPSLNRHVVRPRKSANCLSLTFSIRYEGCCITTARSLGHRTPGYMSEETTIDGGR